MKCIPLCVRGGLGMQMGALLPLSQKGREADVGFGILRLIFLSRICILNQSEDVPGGWEIASSSLLPFRSL